MLTNERGVQMRARMLIVLGCVVFAGIGGGVSAAVAAIVSASGGADPTALLLGDGRSTSTPKAGYIYSCATSAQQGGPDISLPWIHGSTWDSTAKPSVGGSVMWRQATFATKVTASTRTLTGNGLPVGSPTGTFPISKTDPTYRYDPSPNSISAKSVSLSVPANPIATTRPGCVGMGIIGVAVNGVPIFSGFDAGQLDAVAHHVQDLCNGHPDAQSQYHYHNLSQCLPDPGTGQSALLGYAADGYGIYGPRDTTGRTLTNADLDECHGTTSPVKWNGKVVTMYHYVATREFPYTIGCFHGVTSSSGSTTRPPAGSTPPGAPGNAMAPPPTGPPMAPPPPAPPA